MTTIETLTDARIETLRANAAQAGDLVQAAICCVALGESYADVALTDRERQTVSARWPTVAAARAECLSVIRDAEAQS